MSLLACVLAPCLFAFPQGGAEKSKPEDPRKDAKKQSAGFAPSPLPKLLIEHRGTRRLRIDGSLDEWPSVVPVVLRDARQVSGTAFGAYGGAPDISGQMYMLWDEEYLYIAVQVLDDWHRPLRKSTPIQQEIPPVDNVIITFDPARNTRGIGDDPGRREDRTFYLADIERIGDGLIEWDRRRATRNLTRGATCIVDRLVKKSRTQYELRIPWKQILPPGGKPRVRQVLDMQVVLNDYDEATDPLPQTRVGWNFGMGPQIQPGLWGSIMLVMKFDPREDRKPHFPPPPPFRADPPRSRKDWLGLHRQLSATKPVFADVDTLDPAQVGGRDRFRLLEELDRHLETFPRLDNLDYHHRIQRRMVRETAGIRREGLPFFWDHATDEMQRRTVPAPGKDVIRLSRLPQGGWYVRSDTVNFLIDPSGLGIEQLFLRGGVDFVWLTRPQEVTRRHDPTLIRMSASKPKRQFFTHLYFHLTGAKPGSMFTVKPFTDYLMGGLRRITPIGKVTKGGKVTSSIGYLAEWQDGRTLIAAGLSMTKAEIDRLGVSPDVLIVSGQHEQAREIARWFGARHTIIDDVFVAPEYPARFGGRLKYREALRLQSRMKPVRTVILAPGESIDLEAKH